MMEKTDWNNGEALCKYLERGVSGQWTEFDVDKVKRLIEKYRALKREIEDIYR